MTVAGQRPPLPETWKVEDRKTRSVPPPARKILYVLAGVIALVVIVNQAGSADSETSSSALSEVLNDDLSAREEYTADHFRRAAVPPRGAEFDLAERKRRREQNPEDLIQARGEKGSPAAQLTTTTVPAAPRKLFYVPSQPKATAAQHDASGGVTAGSLVRARLRDRVLLRAYTESAVAVVGQGGLLPAGTRLIGTARRLHDAVVGLSFRTAVLPDGREIRVDGEARSEDGSSGLVASVQGGTEKAPDPGRVRDSRTGRRLMSSALSRAPLLGALASDVIDETRPTERRTARERKTLALHAGTEFSVLFRRGISIAHRERGAR